MAHVILDSCSNEKAGECVNICPVDCIEEGPGQFFIDPNTCIDCGACVAACPIQAIVAENDLTSDQEKHLDKAEAFFG